MGTPPRGGFPPAVAGMGHHIGCGKPSGQGRERVLSANIAEAHGRIDARAASRCDGSEARIDRRHDRDQSLDRSPVLRSRDPGSDRVGGNRQAALLQTPPGMWRSGLSATEVSKRLAIGAEAEFLADLDETASIRHRGAEPVFGSGPLTAGTVLGLLYIHVGSALGGLHLLRVARTAPWWRPEREHMLLRPYGDRLQERWRAVLGALEQLDPDDANDAVGAARTGFDVFQRCLVDHLEAAGLR